VKVFVAVSTILAVSAYPIFKEPKQGAKQGEHYFSQERPEAIHKAQEQQRKDYKAKERARQEAKQQQ